MRPIRVPARAGAATHPRGPLARPPAPGGRLHIRDARPRAGGYKRAVRVARAGWPLQRAATQPGGKSTGARRQRGEPHKRRARPPQRGDPQEWRRFLPLGSQGPRPLWRRFLQPATRPLPPRRTPAPQDRGIAASPHRGTAAPPHRRTVAPRPRGPAAPNERRRRGRRRRRRRRSTTDRPTATFVHASPCPLTPALTDAAVRSSESRGNYYMACGSQCGLLAFRGDASALDRADLSRGTPQKNGRNTPPLLARLRFRGDRVC